MLEIFDGFDTFELNRNELDGGVELVELLAEKTSILGSKSEVRRAILENSISINKNKFDGVRKLDSNDVLDNNYILIQRGKKKYFLIRIINN